MFFVSNACMKGQHLTMSGPNSVQNVPSSYVKPSTKDIEFYQPTVPAILPRAQMACSLMCCRGDVTSLMKAGMAPPSTTAPVWFEVPEAMLVKAQAASNCIGGHSNRARKLTRLGIRPAAIMLSVGGCFSLERSFLEIKNKQTIDRSKKVK